MINLKNLCALLILLSLVACDDKAAKPTTNVQSFPQFDSLQTSPNIEQLKAQLFDNPNDFNTLSALGDLYFESNQYLEAIQTYDKALAVNPNCADCLNDRGLALYYSGDPNSAIESFDKAVALDPGFVNSWLSKGFVLISEGRYQEAIAPLNKVKELDTAGGMAVEADKFLAIAAQNGAQ
jgi:tetratricopeptide (TPR) repeat protein